MTPAERPLANHPHRGRDSNALEPALAERVKTYFLEPLREVDASQTSAAVEGSRPDRLQIALLLTYAPYASCPERLQRQRSQLRAVAEGLESNLFHAGGNRDVFNAAPPEPVAPDSLDAVRDDDLPQLP